MKETVQAPLLSVVHDCWSLVAPFAVKVMLSPETPAELASVAVAFAVHVEWPSATIVDGDSGSKVSVVAVPEACAADGITQQQMSAARTLNLIVVRLLILRREQHGTAATKSLILTWYPASP